MPGVTRILSNVVTRIDPPFLLLTHGRFSPSGFIAGFPVYNLTTVGAKSGKQRTHPVIGIPVGDKFVLIASNFGKNNNPAWYYNLLSNPSAQINQDGGSKSYHARQADPKEYDIYWKLAVSTYSGFDSYRRQTTRRIPILILTPNIILDEPATLVRPG